MRNYILYERTFDTKDEYDRFVDYYGIFKWSACMGAFRNCVVTETPNEIKIVTRLPFAQNGGFQRVKKLTEMGFEKVGLIKI